MLGNCSNWLVSCERCTGGKNWGNGMVGNRGNRLVGSEGCCRGNNRCRGNWVVGNRGHNRLVSSEGKGGVSDRMVADGGCEGGDGGSQGGS